MKKNPISTTDTPDDQEDTPLYPDDDTEIYRAAFVGNWEFVRYLLDQPGINLEQIGHEGDNVLHIAAGNGPLENVKKLIECGANIQALDNEGDTPLHCAADSGKIENIAYLLSQGARINEQDSMGYTPLMLAACMHQWEAVGYLINSGADINIKSFDGPSLKNFLLYEESKNYQEPREQKQKKKILQMIGYQQPFEDSETDDGYDSSNDGDLQELTGDISESSLFDYD